MPQTYCPSCDAVIRVDRPRLGAEVRCRKCGVKLEVISTRPFEMYFPLDEDLGSDWEEYEKEPKSKRRRMRDEDLLTL
jgi:lysine biosynthesis protein LysW